MALGFWGFGVFGLWGYFASLLQASVTRCGGFGYALFPTHPSSLHGLLLRWPPLSLPLLVRLRPFFGLCGGLLAVAISFAGLQPSSSCVSVLFELYPFPFLLLFSFGCQRLPQELPSFFFFQNLNFGLFFRLGFLIFLVHSGFL